MSSQYIELQSVATDESYEGSYEPYQRRGQEEYRASNLPVSNWASFKEQFLSLPYGGLDKAAMGAIFGLCSGYAAQCALKTTALLVGVGFVSLQVLQYFGYITINWDTINSQVHGALDVNQDGKVDVEDLNLAKKKVMRALTAGLPSVAGFGTGFLIGFRGTLF